MGGEKLSLPRKKDWKEGQYQIGLFIRIPSGAYVYMDVNAASEDEIRAAKQLLDTMAASAGKRAPALPAPKEPPL